MARDKIQVSVYLDPAVHKWAVAAARADTRTLSQFIGNVLLAQSKGKVVEALAAGPPAEAWNASVMGSLSLAPKPEPARPVIPEPVRAVPPDPTPAPSPGIRLCWGCFATLAADCLKCTECGKDLPLDEPEPPEDEEEDDDPWDPNGSSAPTAPAPDVDESRPPPIQEADEQPERYTPATHVIPPTWVNEYGLTLELQNVVGADDSLEYWPPQNAPRGAAVPTNGGLAH